MIIKSLELKNFRNYESLGIAFDAGTNILYGDNAQGKTNVLESLYVSGTTKSHKGSKDREMIRFDAEEAHIRTVVEKNGVDNRIDIHLKKNSAKGIAVNGIPIRKAGELFGILNLVVFSPEDLNIIKDGPAGRRRFMDMELSQLDSIYLHNLTKYHKILQQRNKLLKDIHYRPDLEATLPIWDEQLVLYGTKIIQRRQGQQRTSALSLKLAEIELVKQLIHDTPVLLLDDVLSELDSNRQNYLLNSIHDIQTIITCTGLDEFVKNRFHINKVFFVREGTIAEQ